MYIDNTGTSLKAFLLVVSSCTTHLHFILQRTSMVLHVPDIDNPGERDAVETLLAMRNSSRINRHNEGSNSAEDDPIYSPYLRASPVRGQRFLRGHEASSSFPEYPRMGRSSKLARVRDFDFFQ